MKKSFAICLALTFVLTGCRSDFEDFKAQALKFAADGQVDKKEYRQLTFIAGSSKDRHFYEVCYTGPRFDPSKMNAYLSKLFAANHLKINLTDLNALTTKAQIEPSKFAVNVYLENSASMDGYVKGPTDFKDAIYSLLGDISLTKYCGRLNLYYINSTIPYSKINAGPDEVSDFIQTLTPGTFRKRGGNRSSSDLKQILQTVMSRTDHQNASVLISDFVFSPGKKADAKDYLANESIGIKIDVAQKLKGFDLSVLILQLNSRFNGFYYDQMDQPVCLNTARPYYIWLIGNTAQLTAIIKSGVMETIRGGYCNKMLLQPPFAQVNADFKVLYQGRVGNFRLQDGSRGPITAAEASEQPRTAGKFSFQIAVDFSQSLQDQSFFGDSSNYTTNLGYSLSVKAFNAQNDVSLNGFSHQLRLTTNDLKSGDLHIKLKGGIPSWVYNSTSESDLSIQSKTAELSKTFGLKYLIEGVYNAFYPPAEDNTISSFDISIKK